MMKLKVHVHVHIFMIFYGKINRHTYSFSYEGIQSLCSCFRSAECVIVSVLRSSEVSILRLKGICHPFCRHASLITAYFSLYNVLFFAIHILSSLFGQCPLNIISLQRIINYILTFPGQRRLTTLNKTNLIKPTLFGTCDLIVVDRL